MTKELPVVEMPQTETIENDTNDLVVRANEVKITNQDTFDAGGAFLKVIKGLADKVKDTFDNPKKLAHAAHKAITAAEGKHLDPLREADAVVRGRMLTWKKAEDAKRAEEQEKIRAEATKAEEDRKLKEAEKHEKAGRTEKAQAVLEAPDQTPAPIVQTVTKPKGIGSSKKWTFDPEEVELDLLVAAIANGDAPLKAIKIDAVFIRQQVTSLKEDFRMDGVRAFPKESLSVR